MYKNRFNYRLAKLKWIGLICSLSFFTLCLSSTANAQTPVSVVYGPTAGAGNWFYGPIYRNTTNAGTLNYSRHAYIYTAAELGIPSGVKIIKLEWLKKDGGTIVAPNTFNVWMMNTTAVSLPSTSAWSALVTGATQTYANTSFPVTIGNNTYLEAPFNVSGNDSFTYTGGSLQILTDWAKFGVQTNAGINFYVQSAAGKSIGISSQNPMVGSTILQSATYGGSRPTLRITYVPVPACAGIPNTGAAISSTNSACIGAPFTLTIQNTIPGTGVSYVWQKAVDGAFAGTIIPVGTSASLNTSETESYYYRCIATCAASGDTYTSTPVYVPLAPHYDCYCPSTAATPADEDIFNVTFGSLNNSSDCNSTANGPGSAPNLYSNYHYVAAPNVEKLSAVPLSVQIGTCLNLYPNRTVVFIDYNHNSVYEASEVVYTSPNAISGPHFETASVLIPATALTGLTGMRVINAEGSPPFNFSLIACAPYSFGETEDYLINITPTTICNGAPTPGNTISNLNSVCIGKTVNLSLQNLTTGQGVSYQWYNSSGPIAGATAFTLTTPPITFAETFYCAVTCSNSGITTNTTPKTITLNPFIDCYCSSYAGGPADADIFNFTLAGVTIGTDCSTLAPGVGSILGCYSNFHPLGSIKTLDLGASVPFDIESDDCDQAPYYSFGTSIYIDFNRNGTFSDPGEQVFNELAPLEGPRHIIGNLVIPCTAQTGQTGMRIVISEGLAGNNINACSVYGYGETEDYIITLKHPDTCSVVSNPPGNTVGTVTAFCQSASSLLTLQNKCMFENFTYQWYEGNYPGTLIPGATSKSYQTPVLTSTTTYYCSVSCGSATVISTPLTIHKVTVTASTTQTASSYCLGGTPVTLHTSHTATGVPTLMTYSYSPSIGLSSATGAIVTATPEATTIYTVTATNPQGCFGTTTVSIESTRLSVSLSATGTSYCTPTGVPITLTGTGGLNYTYSPSAGLTPDTGAIVIATPNVTTTYVMTGSDSTGCSGKDSVTIVVTPCYITLNLKLIIQGYYDALGLMKPVLMYQGIGSDPALVDSIDLELHDENAPFGLVATQKAALLTDGTATANFTGTPSGAYYVAVKHRNGLQTWSASPILVNGTLYDFTTSNTKAYGENMKEIETGLWAFYSGELNADDNIDLLDMSLIEVDVNLFNFGYLNTDINGDGNVDLLDIPLVEDNINGFIFSTHP